MKANIGAESLFIDDGSVELYVNGDKNRRICFNPEDVGFAERFYELAKNLEEKQGEIRNKQKEKLGPDEELSALKEFFAAMRKDIDMVFGEGCSMAAFGEINTLNMFGQFFEGIIPHIRNAREKSAAKYLDGGKGLIEA